MMGHGTVAVGAMESVSGEGEDVLSGVTLEDSNPTLLIFTCNLTILHLLVSSDLKNLII